MSRLIVYAAAALAALVFAIFPAVAAKLAPQSTSQSGVSLSVAPRDLAKPVWEFEVSLNTHSQELSDDLVAASVLIADGGSKHKAKAWQGDPPGGHHRSGVLSFDAISPAPTNIELRIQRPGEAAPRVLRWQLR